MDYQTITLVIAVLVAFTAFLSWRAAKKSAAAAERSAAAAEEGNQSAKRSADAAEGSVVESKRSADAAERSAKAAEQGVEQSDAERRDRKVKDMAEHLKGNHFHKDQTKALVWQLASTFDERRTLFIQGSKCAGYIENLDRRLELLGLTEEPSDDVQP